MYERIVVGTDGSKRAHEAVRRAGELAAEAGITEVDVVSSCDPASPAEIRRVRTTLPREFRDSIDPDLDADNDVAAARAILHEYGVRVRPHSAVGDPAEAIIDVAADRDADLIVVGARGLGAVSRLMHGSVSTKVAHHSPCDVLIVEHGD